MADSLRERILEHIGKSDEFIRDTDRRLNYIDADLREIKQAVQRLPQLIQDVETMKPQVSSWVVTRKAGLWMLGLIGTFSALFTDVVTRVFNKLF